MFGSGPGLLGLSEGEAVWQSLRKVSETGARRRLLRTPLASRSLLRGALQRFAQRSPSRRAATLREHEKHTPGCGAACGSLAQGWPRLNKARILGLGKKQERMDQIELQKSQEARRERMEVNCSLILAMQVQGHIKRR